MWFAEVACLAQFYENHIGPKQSPIARQALERIGEVYAIEARIIGTPPDQRQRVRQSEATPLI